jgi:hypothetical protein
MNPLPQVMRQPCGSEFIREGVIRITDALLK